MVRYDFSLFDELLYAADPCDLIITLIINIVSNVVAFWCKYS